MKTMLSYDYRKVSFELLLLGSDEVVTAYNNLMSYMYNMDEKSTSKPNEIMGHYGKFLLEIRKSLGNQKSTLEEKDMLRSMITDIDNYMK